MHCLRFLVHFLFGYLIKANENAMNDHNDVVGPLLFYAMYVRVVDREGRDSETGFNITHL